MKVSLYILTIIAGTCVKARLNGPPSFSSFKNATGHANRSLQGGILEECQNGAFIPDLESFYTISADDGTFWTHNGKTGDEGDYSQDLVLSEDLGNLQTHWRFHLSAQPGKFLIENRKSGLFLKAKSDGSGKAVAVAGSGLEPTLLEQLLFPIQCKPDGTGIDIEGITLLPSQEVFRTKCVKSSRTCATVTGDPTVETVGSTVSNCFLAHRKKCRETSTPPLTGWIPEKVVDNFTPVCQTGIFAPDPLKYYLIEDPDSGDYWEHRIETQDRNDNGLMTPDMNIRFGKDPESISAHWRFIKSSKVAQFFIIKNRETGMMVKVKNGSGKGITGLPAQNILPSCASRPCDFESEETLRLPVSCNSRLTKVLISSVAITKFSRVFETKCVKSSRTCLEVEGIPFVETVGSRKSNCVRANRKKCKDDTVFRPADGWIVKEVESFDRLPGPSLEVDDVTVPGEAPISAGEIIAGAATIAGGVAAQAFGCPLCGALTSVIFAFGFSALDQSADTATLLNRLAADILERTERMIALSAAADDAEDAANVFAQHRFHFLQQYPGLKHAAVRDRNLPDIDDLSDGLRTRADLYDGEFARYFGNNFDVTEESAALAFLSFDVLTYAMVESLTMRQEGMMLESIGKTNVPCDVLANDLSLSLSATNHKNRLVATRDMMIEAKTTLDKPSSRELCGDCLSRANFFDLDGHGRFLARRLRDAQETEFAIDIEHLSYPIDTFFTYLDNYVESSIELCNAIRTDRQIRNRFFTDVLNADIADCAAPQEMCFIDLDCCSGTCSADGTCQE